MHSTKKPPYFNEHEQHCLVQTQEAALQNANRQIAHLHGELQALAASHAEAMRQLTTISQSPWWRLTAPFRMLGTARWIRRTVRSPKDKNGQPAHAIAVMYGYFGKNLGDDLFFDRLLKRYPDTVFAVYDANGYEAFFNRYPNAYLYTRSDPRVQKIDAYGAKIGKREAFESLLLSKTDLVVHIGGSIYQQIGTWEEDLRMRKKRYKRRHPFFSISSNFGPYHTEGYREFWQKRFAVCRDVCFRDTYSAALFPHTKAVRVAPDLLFSLPLPAVPKKKEQLFVSLMNFNYDGSPFSEEQATRYKHLILDTVIRHLQNGHPVCLSSFCPFLGDEAVADEVVAAVPDALRKQLQVIHYQGDGRFEPLLNAIAESDYMLATRFHAMLFGFSAGIPTLPLCYNQKQQYVLEDLAFDGVWVDLTANELPDADTVLSYLKNQPILDVSTQRQQAIAQFERLDAAVAKRGGRIQSDYSIQAEV